MIFFGFDEMFFFVVLWRKEFIGIDEVLRKGKLVVELDMLILMVIKLGCKLLI